MYGPGFIFGMHPVHAPIFKPQRVTLVRDLVMPERCSILFSETCLPESHENAKITILGGPLTCLVPFGVPWSCMFGLLEGH